MKEIFDLGWTYGFYQDDRGSCNPYEENSKEWIVHQLGYLYGLKDANVKLSNEDEDFISNNIEMYKMTNKYVEIGEFRLDLINNRKEFSQWSDRVLGWIILEENSVPVKIRKELINLLPID